LSCLLFFKPDLYVQVYHQGHQHQRQAEELGQGQASPENRLFPEKFGGKAQDPVKHGQVEEIDPVERAALPQYFEQEEDEQRPGGGVELDGMTVKVVHIGEDYRPIGPGDAAVTAAGQETTAGANDSVAENKTGHHHIGAQPEIDLAPAAPQIADDEAAKKGAIKRKTCEGEPEDPLGMKAVKIPGKGNIKKASAGKAAGGYKETSLQGAPEPPSLPQGHPQHQGDTDEESDAHGGGIGLKRIAGDGEEDRSYGKRLLDQMIRSELTRAGS